MEWVTILSSAFSAAILTQIFAWFREWMVARRRRNDSASYLAIRIAVSLEEFAGNCSILASNIRNYESSSGTIGSPLIKLPVLENYPDDEDGWRSLGIKLVDLSLSFRNRISSSQRSIEFTEEVGDGEYDAQWKCFDEACKLGIEALNIASDLRNNYKFSEYEPADKTREYLTGASADAEKRRNEEVAEQASIWASFEANDTSK